MFFLIESYTCFESCVASKQTTSLVVTSQLGKATGTSVTKKRAHFHGDPVDGRNPAPVHR